MAPETIIRAENLSKLYRLGAAERRSETLVDALGALLTAPVRNLRRLRGLDTAKVSAAGKAEAEADDLLWAVRDVSFAVARGEVLGVVGRNGAGKSTLLKILSRITEPTRGRVRIRGRVSSLLEVGTGFHPELTGRENVYLNGTILGMTKREIDRKFDEIVEFSGVQRVLDTPVKRYSSGQRVRLAFAVAANLEPEILIVDEVLAVGDTEFQRKCLGKMRDVARGGGGRTVLFVSHNMAAVQNFCTRLLVLRDGGVVHDGDVDRGIQAYLEAGAQAADSGALGQRIAALRLLNQFGQPIDTVPTGEPVVVELDIDPRGTLHDAVVAFRFLTPDGVAVVNFGTWTQYGTVPPLDAPQTFRCEIPALNLAPGEFLLSVFLLDGPKLLESHEGTIRVHVVESNCFGTGRIYPASIAPTVMPCKWTVGVEAAR